MTHFIHTDRGYRRLSDVKKVRIAEDGKRSLLGEDNEKISDYGEIIDGRIISIIQPHGEWEHIYYMEDEDGGRKLFSEPVIAWGLTAIGSVIPVVPTVPEGLPDSPAIRKVGRPEIYVGSSIYNNEEEWERFRDAQ